MQIKPIKLSPKKGGNGYVSSYSVNLGCAEVRTVGFLDDNGNPLPLEKVIDSENQQIIIKLKAADKLRSKSAKTPEILTTISTFSDFLRYSGITRKQIKKDWEISDKEMHRWIEDETSIPAWVIPMLIELYNVSDLVEYCPLGSAIII